MTLQEISLQLKSKGYPQDICTGDMVYSAKGNQYVEFRGNFDILPPEWVKVPTLNNIVNLLRQYSYDLSHIYLGYDNSEIKENWILEYKDKVYQDSNIWVVVALFWMDDK